MSIQFVPIALSDIRGVIQQHLTALPSAVDSFLEDHIAESVHYQIRVLGETAGYTSIHKGKLIMQFALKPSYRHHGQSVYSQVKKLDEVQSAYVPTCDEFFLSHALDDYHQLAKQAYFFAARLPMLDEEPSRFALRPAEKGDIETIREASGDFFGSIENYISKQELFLTLADDACVGFGVMAKSELAGNVASIGMYIIERFRKQGAGTATLRLLKAECQQKNLRPIAGCWYYNHLSKKTLERAGMFTQTRLLKIDY